MTLYFIPNPGPVAPEVLAAQASPPEAFSAAFENETAERLKDLFFPEAEQLSFFNCAREGLYQLAFSNFCGEKNLFIVDGPMSQEWYDAAKEAGVAADLFDSASGSALKIQQLSRQLELEPYETIHVVETDVYTGAHQNIAHIAALVRAKLPEAVLIVDCSGAVSCNELVPMENKVDIYLCASEMALGLPPGLGIVAANRRVHTKIMARPATQSYFSYNWRNVSRKENRLAAAAPYQLLSALDRQIDRILLEGIDERFARMHRMSLQVQEWSEKHAFLILAEEAVRAPNVSVLVLPSQFTPADLSGYLEHFGIYIGKTYGEARDKAVIIAHMNNILEADLDVLFEVMNRFLTDYDTRGNRIQSTFMRMRR